MSQRIAPTPATAAMNIPARDHSQLRAAYEAALATIRALTPLVDDQAPEGDGTAQGRVLDALIHLRTEGGPSTSWTIPDERAATYRFPGAVHLDGQLLMGDDDERRRGMAVWQRILGAGPVTADRTGARLHLRITGSYHGVTVGVSTIVDADDAPEAVAA